MEENKELPKFEAGNKVVLKHQPYVVYLFISYEPDNKAKCLDSKNKEVMLPLSGLKHYIHPSYGGGTY